MNVIRKKGPKSKKAVEKKTSSTTDKTQVHATEFEEEKPLDFGGIPARDFKKNLGCG
jgi:hypothetical protein